MFLGTNTALTQNSLPEFQKILRDTAAFDETGFAALQQGETVVKLLPVQDKREVAVCGLVGLQVPADVFLQSFTEGMSRKANPAILEIGRFTSNPTLDDLQSLTIESRDLDDMKECVVGDCRLKLSAGMIQRFHKDVDLEAPDYHARATQVLKQMLLEYVRDYLARGDAALIAYSDKSKEIRLADEHRALMSAATSYIGDVLPQNAQSLKDFPASELRLVENAIVWSKIKFGLKPVLAINHITVYKREQETGPQVLVQSKQIYANHYFNSSLALTAFVNIPGANPGSYLYYENRSRADGLDGVFGKMKRGIVEEKALDSLTTILASTKGNLHARSSSPSDSAPATHGTPSWKRWKLSRGYVFLCLFLITALLALWTINSYDRKGGFNRGAH